MTISFVKRHVIWFQLLVFVISFALFSFVAVMTFQTLVYDPPFSANDTKIGISKRANGEYMLEIWRTLRVESPPKSAKVTRYIKHTETGTIIDWGAADREFINEIEPVHRIMSMGHEIPKGQWCITIILSYTPAFSIIEHRYVTSGVCTNVTH